MSCRECGCFTLFKDVCSSCKRASSVFSELAISSNKSPEDQLHSNHELRHDAIEPLASSPEESTIVDNLVKTDSAGAEDANPISTPSEVPENVTAVAAKLGINLGDLQGVFDINELSSDIANTEVPDPVKLITCQNCTQKVKEKIKCPYCGHANNNF